MTLTVEIIKNAPAVPIQASLDSLRITVNNTHLTKIVKRHLHLHLVAHGDPDEVFPHLAGNMRQYLMPIGQSHAKHRTGQHLSY